MWRNSLKVLKFVVHDFIHISKMLPLVEKVVLIVRVNFQNSGSGSSQFIINVRK